MNDINTITSIDQDAVQKAVPGILARGHFAIEEYTGLNLINVHERESEVEANSLACDIGLKAGHHATVRRPSAPGVGDDNVVGSAVLIPLPIPAIISADADGVTIASLTPAAEAPAAGGGDFAGAGASGDFDETDTAA